MEIKFEHWQKWVCPFSTWSNNSTWNPTIFIGTQEICVKITPCLLGVILDRSLMLTTHQKKLTTLLSSSICIIWATACASWDWCHSNLKMACHTLIHSKLNYTAPAWQPRLSVTNLSYLDYPKNCFLRHIIGQLVFTPLEALQLEAYVLSYHTCSNHLILKAREKTLCSTNNHPKRVALAADIPLVFKIAQASVENQNFPLYYHPNFNTDRTSSTFHLHHGSIATLMKEELSQLFLVSLVELMTLI